MHNEPDAYICQQCVVKLQKKRDGLSVESDPVNPAHYQGDYVMRIIEDFKLGFCLGNVVKYVLRAENKGRVEDLKKASWYLNREIARLEK
jgi:hypothetical protein